MHAKELFRFLQRNNFKDTKSFDLKNILIDPYFAPETTPILDQLEIFRGRKEHFAKEQKIRVIIDPKGSDYSMYNGAYLIKPNELEFETIVGKPKNKQDMIKKGKELKESLNLDALLLTLGKNGMMLFHKK